MLGASWLKIYDCEIYDCAPHGCGAFARGDVSSSSKIASMNHLKGCKLNESFDPLDGYNDVERSEFKKFKNLVLAELPKSGFEITDVTLRRFFDADRNDGEFEAEESLKRLRDTLLWRKRNNVDSLRTSKPDILPLYEKMRVRQFFGFDKHSRPVQFERLGEFFNLGNASCRVLTEEYVCRANVIMR